MAPKTNPRCCHPVARRGSWMVLFRCGTESIRQALGGCQVAQVKDENREITGYNGFPEKMRLHKTNNIIPGASSSSPPPTKKNKVRVNLPFLKLRFT